MFDTAIGRCGIAWGPRGVCGTVLPGPHDRATRQELVRRFPGARELPPPTPMARAVSAIQTLLDGQATDLSRIPLDLGSAPPFHRRVYEFARRVPPGKTLTYGELASRVGSPGSARAVGQAMRRNPFPIVVPCHRVVAAGGGLGGFTAPGGVSTKRRMLGIEGADVGRRTASGGRTEGFPFDVERARQELCRADPTLGRLIESVGPFRMELKKTRSVFIALAEAVVYQQLTGRAAATIWSRVCALYPRRTPTAAGTLAMSEEQMRSAGLSLSKTRSLRDLAAKVDAGELPGLAKLRRMDDQSIIERLTQVHGIGRWTVEMLLMFRLGRPDVLPADDYGIRKGYAVAFKKRELPGREQLEKRADRWKPYRTMASWYLWRANE